MNQFLKWETWSLISFPMLGVGFASAAQGSGYIPKDLNFSHSSNNADVEQYRLDPSLPSKEGLLDGLLLGATNLAIDQVSLFKQIPLIEHVQFRNIGNFYNHTVKSILISKDSYATLNALNEWSLWFDFSGGYTTYRQDGFSGLRSNSLMVRAGASMTFDNFLTLGLGLGVSGSDVKWRYEELDLNSSGRLMSVFGGPYMGVEFGGGAFLSTQILTQWTDYSLDRNQPYAEGSKAVEIKSTPNALDFGVRVEGGLDISLSHRMATYCKPLFSIDFVSVIEPKYTEENKAVGLNHTSDSAHSGFIDATACAEFRVELLRSQGGVIVPSLSLGGLFSAPLTSKTRYQVTTKNDQRPPENQKRKCEAQCIIKGDVCALFKQGLGVNVQYEARLLGNTPTQLVRMGVDIEW